MQNKAFDIALNELKEIIDGNDFLSYLITPVQRMPRYLLFFKELIKCTPPTHPDSNLVYYAFEKIEETTNSAEMQSERARQQTILYKLQEKLKKPSITIVDPSRRILYVKDVSIYYQKKESVATLYLCNDIIFIVQDQGKVAKLFYHSNVVNFHYNHIPGHFRSIKISTLINNENASSFSTSSSTNIKTVFPSLEFNITFYVLEDKSSFFDQLKRTQQAEFSKIPRNNILVWSLDAISDSIPSLYQHAAISNDQSIIFCGGIISRKAQISDFFTLDQQKVRETLLSQMATCEMGIIGRRRHTLTYMDNALYMIGGITNGKEVDTIMKFDINLKKWIHILPKFHDLRYGHTTVSYQGSLYVFGGKSKSSQAPPFIKINDKNVEVIKSKNQPISRFGHTSVVFRKKMYNRICCFTAFGVRRFLRKQISEPVKPTILCRFEV